MSKQRVSDQILEGGEVIWAHHKNVCDGPPCPIHHRTDHAMRSFPQHFRYDRFMMERICPHGIGHPDPDTAFAPGDSGIHGCDGCCRP